MYSMQTESYCDLQIYSGRRDRDKVRDSMYNTSLKFLRIGSAHSSVNIIY